MKTELSWSDGNPLYSPDGRTETEKGVWYTVIDGNSNDSNNSNNSKRTYFFPEYLVSQDVLKGRNVQELKILLDKII
jgi:hypothetical protein